MRLSFRHPFKKEPVITWSLVAGVFNVLQVAALPVAPWVNITIVVISYIAAALAARKHVIPNTP
jgi:hypothetical protein